MKRDEILRTIDILALSQGFYGRLSESLKEVQRIDPVGYDNLLSYWESQNFKDSLDFILFLEG